MIGAKELYSIFEANEVDFFTGVPDSTFKGFMSFLAQNPVTNIVACNECEAIALAAGYHLATGNVGVAYMQNAGLGKTVNPITSLCDPEVYGIPMLLMIGWRGEPGKPDEPQHRKMGKITLDLLDTLGISYKIMEDPKEDIKHLLTLAKKNNSPTALIIKKGEVEKPKSESDESALMSREKAIGIVMDNLSDDVLISTTGKTSRELFEYRVTNKTEPSDFYTVGSMGCCSSIGLGVALNTKRRVVVLDGDGAVLMQLGSLATIGHYKPGNLLHIVFDNQAYDSTGGQPTVSSTVDLSKVARESGYGWSESVKTVEELNDAMKTKSGPGMIVVRVKRGARKDLGRPTKTPSQNKKSFMDVLR